MWFGTWRLQFRYQSSTLTAGAVRAQHWLVLRAVRWLWGDLLVRAILVGVNQKLETLKKLKFCSLRIS